MFLTYFLTIQKNIFEKYCLRNSRGQLPESISIPEFLGKMITPAMNINTGRVGGALPFLMFTST